MVRETQVSLTCLIYPLFLTDGKGRKEAIASMPGIYRWSADLVEQEIAVCYQLGIRSFILFPAVDEQHKDRVATYSYAADNFYLRTVRHLKTQYPDACFISDVAMDPYNSDGHDGLVENGRIVNDATLPILAKMALAQAEAGFDIIGPSDMMDGRVRYLRDALDHGGFTDVGIMSYTAKYASAFYGPFREALDSAPRMGDKKTYQMDPANAREALREASLDEAEGADFLMVKPALSYLDVIQRIRCQSQLPLAAYNVSGEYAMVKAAAANGWIDGTKAMHEILLSIRRAGADLILTYFAKEYAEAVAGK